MALINYVTEIHFGAGVLADLKEVCNRLGITKPLIVTDRGCLLYTSPSPRD